MRRSRGSGRSRAPATPRGRSRETGQRAAGPAGAADRRDPPAPAGLLRDQDRRRARVQARAPRRELRDARADRHGPRFEQLWRDPTPAGRDGRRAAARRLRDRMRLGDLRALADRRSGRRLLPRRCGAPRSARSTSRDAVAPPPRDARGAAVQAWEPPLHRARAARSRRSPNRLCAREGHSPARRGARRPSAASRSAPSTACTSAIAR